MQTKKISLNKVPMDLYAKLARYCKENNRSLNLGIQYLLAEEMNKYFAKQEKLDIYKENKNG